MTREMNKPDWHSKWVKTECYYGTLYEFEKENPSNSRELDDWIKPFIDELNKRLENKQ